MTRQKREYGRAEGAAAAESKEDNRGLTFTISLTPDPFLLFKATMACFTLTSSFDKAGLPPFPGWAAFFTAPFGFLAPVTCF